MTVQGERSNQKNVATMWLPNRIESLFNPNLMHGLLTLDHFWLPPPESGSTALTFRCLILISHIRHPLKNYKEDCCYIILPPTCLWCCSGDSILLMATTLKCPLAHRGMKLSDYDRGTPSICRASIVTRLVVLLSFSQPVKKNWVKGQITRVLWFLW